MIIGIISYLPEDEKLREKRLSAHRKQIDLLLKLNCNIYIVAQNYRQNELIYNPNIYYFNYEKGIGMANARNVLLQYFYNSNEDWMFMCDDDAYYYEYYDINVFFEEIKNTPDKFKQLDLIRGKFASKIPFKKTVYKDSRNRDYYLFKDENTIGSVAMCLIRNLNKYYNKQIYMQDISPSKGEGYEDKNFCCDLKLNNIKTHVLQTFIMTTYNYTDNSSLFSTYEDRIKLHNQNNESTLNRYKDTNIFVNGRMNQIYRNEPVLVKRIKPMIIADNLIPDTVTKNTKNSLFQ